LKVHDAVRWVASVAVQMIAVVPTGNVEPLAGAQLTVVFDGVAMAVP
jgi:hypothetical protein